MVKINSQQALSKIILKEGFMEIEKVLNALDIINNAFGGVIRKVQAGRESVVFDVGYIYGKFRTKGLCDFGDIVVDMSLRDLKRIYGEGTVDEKVEEDIVVFDKGFYDVRMRGERRESINFQVYNEGDGIFLNVENLYYGEGFNIKRLIGKNVAIGVEGGYVRDGELWVINPVWAVRCAVSCNEDVMLSKGFLSCVGDLIANGLWRVALNNKGVEYWEFIDEGVVMVRLGGVLGVDVVERVRGRLKFDEDLLGGVEAVKWLRDWGGNILLWCDEAGRIVGGEVFGSEKEVVSKSVGDIKRKVSLDEDFVEFLCEADVGVVVEDILWLRKGNMDMFIKVRG